MAPFDRSHRTSNQSAIVSIALSCTIFEIFDVEYSDLEIYVRVALRTYARSVRRRNLQTRLFLDLSSSASYTANSGEKAIMLRYVA